MRLSAYLCVKGAAEALDFYRRAFGAEEVMRLPMDDGRLGHAEIRLGESVLMLADEFPEIGVKSPATLGGTPVSLSLEVDDVDEVFDRAVMAGARVERPLKDEPYGRIGWVIDPFGHRWSIVRANPDWKP